MNNNQLIIDRSGSTRKIKPKPRFIVERGGVPCALHPCPDVFGTKLVPKKGVLMPRPNDPHYFAGEKSAAKAAARAVKLRNALNSAVFGLTEKLKPFAEPGEFIVKKIGAQGA